MKVLISWSGELSHRAALLLREPLPMFLQVAGAMGFLRRFR